MKILRFNFYSTIYIILLMVIVAALLTALNSCATIETIEPKPDVIFPMDGKDMIDPISFRGDEMAWPPIKAAPDPDYAEYTPPIDTSGELEIDTTCEDSLYLTPQFVTGFMEIDETVTTDIEVWVYPHHATATTGDQIPFILDSLLYVYDPTLTYKVYQSDTDWRRMAFIADGTLDKEHFHGEVFIRFNGHNSGWGFGVTPQAFLFAGALNFDEYMAVVNNYPSVDYFNFRNLPLTQEEYVKAAIEIRRCHLGRYWADFRFNQFEIPDSIVVMYENVNWTHVLH